MAPLPAGQSGVPLQSPERSQAPGPRRPLSRARDRLPSSRTTQLALAALILLVLGYLAWHFNVPPRHDALRALPDTVRAVLAAVVVFGIAGLGLVRLLLPARLRRYEVLWILPTGGCVVGLALTVLGFAGVPYPVSLPLVLVVGVAVAVYGVRSRGWPEMPPQRVAWPVFLAVVVLAVALVPMVFRQHYAAPVGTGSDAHVATGVASFLSHSYPTGVNTSTPINQMQPTWKSKYPIYYAFAAVTSVSGLQSWQVLAPLAAVMLSLAALGLFLVARELFALPIAVALVAMAVAALDRMALYTVLNPYFNQTWGFFALPFTLVLGWFVVQPELSRGQRRGTLVLLVLFALVLVLAYPLAAPIPAVPIAIFIWMQRRRRIAAGLSVFRVKQLYRGRKSLLWLVPLAALLAIPVIGAVQKGVAAVEVLAPGHSLAGWGGDLGHFVPFAYFFSLPNSALGIALFMVLLAFAIYGLATAPRALATGLGGLFLLGLLLAAYLRHRQYGYYFQFKLLAFVGPLVLLTAAMGAAKLRRAGPAWLAVLSVATIFSVFAQVGDTGFQLPQATIQLSSWADALPANASIRLDMWPPDQLWAAYFLDSRRVCSQLPLLGTDYPHVPISRKADYIVATLDRGRPADAIGQPLRQNLGYRLFREAPNVPGPDVCSRRRLDRLYGGTGHSPQ